MSPRLGKPRLGIWPTVAAPRCCFRSSHLFLLLFGSRQDKQQRRTKQSKSSRTVISPLELSRRRYKRIYVAPFPSCSFVSCGYVGTLADDGIRKLSEDSRVSPDFTGDLIPSFVYPRCSIFVIDVGKLSRL